MIRDDGLSGRFYYHGGMMEMDMQLFSLSETSIFLS